MLLICYLKLLLSVLVGLSRGDPRRRKRTQTEMSWSVASIAKFVGVNLMRVGPKINSGKKT